MKGSLWHTKEGDFDPSFALVIGTFAVGVFGFVWEVLQNNGASGPAWAWLGGGSGGAIVGGAAHSFARAKRLRKEHDADAEAET